MNKKIIWFFTLALSIACGQAAFASHMGKHSDDACPSAFMKNMADKLALTPEQRTKIQAIKEQIKPEMKAQWEQMRAIRTQLTALVRSDKIDESKLDDLISQKKELMGTLMKKKIMARNQMYNVLTAKQKAAFDAMMQKWEAARAKKWEAYRMQEQDKD